jgi:hypothetical protein
MWFWGIMGFRKAVILGALTCLLSANNALAFGSGAKNTAPEFGKTLPPVGFVKFCATNPDDCKTRSAAQERISMSPERWNQLYWSMLCNSKIAPSALGSLRQAEHEPIPRARTARLRAAQKRQLEGWDFPRGVAHHRCSG